MLPSKVPECGAPVTGSLHHPGKIACDRCGEKFRSAAERIRLDGERYICGACYQSLLYPDLVIRHPDFPD